MRLVLHPDAVAEATAAGDWYDAWRRGLGGHFATELERAFEAILENPRAWPLWPGLAPSQDVRRFLLPRFPFAVAYVASPDVVMVLAVAHTRRRPGYWIARRSTR